MDNNYQITHIFHGHQISSDQVIHIQSQQESFLSIEIQLGLTKGQAKLPENIPETEDTPEADVSSFELTFSYEPNIELTVPVLDDGSVRARSFLYYEAQTDMWRLILELARELNVQVFATTHSWDCISAFQEALTEIEDSSVGKLFRLSRKGENIRAVDYPAEKLGVAVRQNIEVR